MRAEKLAMNLKRKKSIQLYEWWKKDQLMMDGLIIINMDGRVKAMQASKTSAVGLFGSWGSRVNFSMIKAPSPYNGIHYKTVLQSVGRFRKSSGSSSFRPSYYIAILINSWERCDRLWLGCIWHEVTVGPSGSRPCGYYYKGGRIKIIRKINLINGAYSS